MANDGNKVAVASRFYAQHAKAVLGVVERYPLDGAGDYLAVRLGGGGRHGHRSDNWPCRSVWRAPESVTSAKVETAW
jgi:hypothetical protein